MDLVPLKSPREYGRLQGITRRVCDFCKQKCFGTLRYVFDWGVKEPEPQHCRRKERVGMLPGLPLIGFSVFANEDPPKLSRY